MTHTLNRRGLSEDRLGEEIVFLCMIHRKFKEKKGNDIIRLARTIFKYKPDNIIGAVLGLDEESVIQMSAHTGIVTAVFTDKQKALEMFEEIKMQRLGISVVISALFKDVAEICKNVGLVEHTHNISLGIFGRTDKLPDEKTLQIATQCGHALVSPNLIKHVVKKIKKAKMTGEEAAALLTKPCVCGVVNPDRTKRLLLEMANEN